jgi:hypothetical protein
LVERKWIDRVDIVTVCYAPELHMLKLQARSIGRHLDAGSVGRVWVILNDDDVSGSRRYFEREIAAEYGPHAAKIVLAAREDITPVKLEGRGWRIQQVLKLCVANRVASECYLMLDAKNHFIRPVSKASYFDTRTRFRTSRSALRRGPLAVNFRASYKYFGIDPEPHIDRAPPGITPFGVRSGRVREMLEHISSREGEPFESFFMKKDTHVVEIFLCQAFALATLNSLTSDFRFEKKRTNVTMWYRNVANKLNAKVDATEKSDTLTFAVHRKTFAALSDAQRKQVASVWRRANLIEKESDVELFCSPFGAAAHDAAALG